MPHFGCGSTTTNIVIEDGTRELLNYPEIRSAQSLFHCQTVFHAENECQWIPTPTTATARQQVEAKRPTAKMFGIFFARCTTHTYVKWNEMIDAVFSSLSKESFFKNMTLSYGAADSNDLLHGGKLSAVRTNHRIILNAQPHVGSRQSTQTQLCDERFDARNKENGNRYIFGMWWRRFICY